jgi:DNA-binding response OmpR family regulator
VRVLVVEDEVRMAALIRRGLEEDGYAVDVATNGPDGLWQARERAGSFVPAMSRVRVSDRSIHATPTITLGAGRGRKNAL